MSWFHMPLGVVTMYLGNLRKLEGERSLNSVAIVAMGTGSMDKNDRRNVLRQWRTDGPVRRLTPEERKANMAAVGIVVVEG